MATVRKELVTPARPGLVWEAIRDFGALHTRLVPGFVVDTRLEPGARIVTFGNGLGVVRPGSASLRWTTLRTGHMLLTVTRVGSLTRRSEMSRKVGIIGDGNVGAALARGLQKAGREVKTVGNDKPRIRETADWADIVILAVPYPALGSVVEAAGSGLDGKVLVDVTNVLDSDMNLALGFTTSGAEELQGRARKSHVVKAFNTVFAQHMDTGRLADQPLTVFVAGDDQAARSDVLELARAIGFDPVDAGPLRNARLLEPLGYLNIQLGYVHKMGTSIGLKLLRSS